MKQLATGILTRYKSDAGVTLRTLLEDEPQVEGQQKFWFGDAPHGVSLPVVVFSMPPAGSEDGSMSSSGTSYINKQLVQFSAYVEEYTLATNILDEIKKLFDNYGVTLSAGGKVQMVKRMNPGFVVRDPDGGYDVNVDYEYTYSESL